MVGSERAAIAADAGRGDSDSFDSKVYRVILSPLPSGDAMNHAVVLHCGIAGRLYRIKDFRKPLADDGMLRDVAVLGAYQMSHVWRLNLRTAAAKQKLLEAARLFVRGRPCLVMKPARQELRVKFHWCRLMCRTMPFEKHLQPTATSRR